MNYQVLIHSDFNHELAIQELEKAAQATLSHHHALDGALTLVLTTDETIQDLNREFAGANRTTDVLSFYNGETDPETGNIYYGDVVLSVPAAERQAQAAGHALEDELTLLIVHGVLHLLGFQHSEDEDQLKMWSAQDEILTRLGRKILSPR